jgi:hypothetical protein
MLACIFLLLDSRLHWNDETKRDGMVTVPDVNLLVIV